MKAITLDLESYFDSTFSLKRMTVPEYVHDPRFHVHGIDTGPVAAQVVDCQPIGYRSNRQLIRDAVGCRHPAVLTALADLPVAVAVDVARP